MKVLHQLGFRDKWNRDIFKEENIGDGFIFSPINIDSDKLCNLDHSLKRCSFLDPQLYFLNEPKSNFESYPYYPSNIKEGYSTIDLMNQPHQLISACYKYQVENDFEYLVIPTKYLESYPNDYFRKTNEFLIKPFLDIHSCEKKVLLTLIIKRINLTDKEQFDYILSWVTGKAIDGVYLIFEDDFTSKQIKDFDFLLKALTFISILKDNDLEVHLGYCNTESLIYSVAMPDSITMGSYENLRSFKIHRFQNSDNGGRSPNPRIYSSKLLQWVEYTYIQAMRSKMPDNYLGFFDKTKYINTMFELEGVTDGYKWHFMKKEPYKHYFEVFYGQAKSLSDNQNERKEQVRNMIYAAIENFKKIKPLVLLDENSDDSHLPTWINVLNSY